MPPTATSSQKSHSDPPKPRSRASRSRKVKSSKTSKQSNKKPKISQEKKAPMKTPPATFAPKPEPNLDSISIQTPSIPTSISVIPDIPKSQRSICSNKTGTSTSNASNFVTLEQFEHLKQNMATKEDISKISQALADLAKAQTAPLYKGDAQSYDTADGLDADNYLNRSLYGHNTFVRTCVTDNK